MLVCDGRVMDTAVVLAQNVYDPPWKRVCMCGVLHRSSMSGRRPSTLMTSTRSARRPAARVVARGVWADDAADDGDPASGVPDAGAAATGASSAARAATHAAAQAARTVNARTGRTHRRRLITRSCSGLLRGGRPPPTRIPACAPSVWGG